MDLVGTTLGGRYRVVRRIDAGGMGVVWEAVQVDLGRRVAVKTLHAHLATDATTLERFRREATQVAALRHPNIVQITDFSAGEGADPFYVMEYLEGSSLAEIIRRTGRVAPERAVFISLQVLAALGVAHEAGLVHRDVKPGNVFVTPIAGGADLVKVLDFGVAKVVRDGPPSSFQSDVRHVVGTVSYMAPEQLLGEAIDGRADLYAVGATLYHALAGRRPFEEATSPVELTRAICRDAPEALDAGAGLDAALARVVARALAKSPDERFPRASDMARALAPFARVAPPSRESGRITVEIEAPVIPSAAVPSGARPTAPPSTLPLGRSDAPRFSEAPPTEPSGPPSTKDAPTLPEPRPAPITSETAPIPLVSAPAAAPFPLVPTLEGTPASDPTSAPLQEGTLRSKSGDVPALVAQIRAAQADAPTMRVSESLAPRPERGPSLLLVAIALFVVALVLGAAAAWVGLR